MSHDRSPRTPAVTLRLHLGKLLYIFFVCLVFNAIIIGPVLYHWLNWYLTIVWSIYLPITLIGLVGALASQKQSIKPYTDIRQERIIFLIPTIARRDTLPGLRRVVDSILLCAAHQLPNLAIHILVEEEAEGVEEIKCQYWLDNRVCCIVVPKSYTPANRTRYKARANEYALQYRRSTGLNRPDIFIYHGDDDTSIGHDTVWSIARFIEENKYDLAQGLLTFPHQLSPSWLCRLADSIRPADDMSRFYFFTGKLGRPLAGLHGEHLLIRASIEDAIGWDFGPFVTVEDAYFGLTFAMRFPGRSTFLPSRSYGASPSNVRDLIRQRRRWANGLTGLVHDKHIAWKAKLVLCYSVVIWATGIFQHVALVLLIASLTNALDTSPVVPIVIACWCANFSFQVWMYLEGLRINLEASQASRWRFAFMPLVQIVAIPFLSLIESWSSFLGLIDFLRHKQGFDVIGKMR